MLASCRESDMVFVMLPRRTVLQAPFLLAAERAGADTRKMTLSMHQFTSARAGYQKSLEGWAKAGIREVEPAAGLLDDYLKTDTLASAKRILTDNGLKIVSGAVGVTGLWEPNPNFQKNLAAFQKRCEQFAELGAPLVYSPCATTARFTPDDYFRCLGNIRQAAEVARQFHIEDRRRVRAQFHVPGLASDGPSPAAGGCASELRDTFRLLSLLVRPKQV